MIASSTLRARVRSDERKRFFASCWVRVLPPCTTAAARRFAQAARAMEIGESPWCSKNRWSSTATSPATSTGGASWSRTITRSSWWPG